MNKDASSIFITATGTGLGKTFLSSMLAKKMIENGDNIKAIKPVATGFNYGKIEHSDSGILLSSLNKPVNIEEIKKITPWIYKNPVSPAQASIKENKFVDFKELLKWCENEINLCKRNDSYLLVEGIGGIMVPLNTKNTVFELLKKLKIPVILMTGSYLGSISHTLTAYRSLKSISSRILSIVVNESIEENVGLDETLQILSHFILDVNIRCLRRDSNLAQEDIDVIASDIYEYS